VKNAILPCAVLALLLAAALWSARSVETEVAACCAALETASAAAQRGDWPQAETALSRVRAQWAARRARYHLVTAHDALDAADALFAEAASHASERDRGAFLASLAALTTHLRAISARQQLSLRSVL